MAMVQNGHNRESISSRIWGELLRVLHPLMAKIIVTVGVLVEFSTVCFAQTSVSGNSATSCAVAYHGKTHFIRLQETNKEIGRVEYSKTLGKYVSFAHFPFHIPYAHRRRVKEFLAELTENTGLPGRYYIDMSCGEFGYYELADSPVWNPRDVYKMWPEIFRIISINARISTVMKTIRMFPLAERTHGDLNKMGELHGSDRDPGEFSFDSFSVEDDLRPPVPAKKEQPVVIDREKINTDVEKLLANTKFPCRAELKKAVGKRDMEAVSMIAGRADLSEEARRICALYTAVYGDRSAEENFRLAKKNFMAWKPEIMMAYLQQAVKAEHPEAEHFLGQYLYRFDQGTPEEIFGLFQRAYKHGYADAEASLARCLWFGFGTKKDQRKAFEMAKNYLAKVKDPNWGCLHSIAKTVAGLGYLKFDKNKEKGLKFIHDPVTVQGVFAADCVSFYGLYGVPQSFCDHELDGGLEPHWTHLDVLTEGFPSKRDQKIIGILDYQ